MSNDANSLASYDSAFYSRQIAGAMGSAEIIVPMLTHAVSPGSVVDFWLWPRGMAVRVHEARRLRCLWH